jgi:hypothetical protein
MPSTCGLRHLVARPRTGETLAAARFVLDRND